MAGNPSSESIAKGRGIAPALSAATPMQKACPQEMPVPIAQNSSRKNNMLEGVWVTWPTRPPAVEKKYLRINILCSIRRSSNGYRQAHRTRRHRLGHCRIPPDRVMLRIERFAQKWEPVLRNKTRQNNNFRACADPTSSQHALAST